MGSPKSFNLRWDGFEANTRNGLMELREEVEFLDVTLVSGDSKQVKANKVILAGGSSFFHRILRENPHPHPLIYLKEVSYKHLLSVLDFLYTGEADIDQEDLNHFVDIAEDLKIKGLTPTDIQTKSLPKPGAPLQSKMSAQEKAPAKNKASPPSVIPASEDQVAAEEQVSSKSLSSSRRQNSAGEDAPSKTISSSHSFLPALDQGQVSADERTSSPRKPLLRSLTPHSSNTFQKNNSEDEDDTCYVKVEVGNAEHYVSYGMNDEGEQYITGVSKRGLHNNKQNTQQNEEYQNEGMEQDQNDQGISAGKKLKKELVVSNNDTFHTKAVDSTVANEEVNHAWYIRSQENDGLDENIISMRSCGDKDEVVDSKCDIIVTEVANSDFINDQLTNDWYEQVKDNEDDKMTHEVEQGINNEAFYSGGAFYKPKSIHTGEKPYQCLVCHKSFSRLDILNEHKSIHTGKKPQCLVCHKSFSRLDTLSKHKSIHIGEKPHQCLVCHKSFSRLDKLNNHKRTHTGEKPHQCLVCHKTFSRLDKLNDHKRNHTGEKPHQCSQCSKKFISSSHLKQHKNKKKKCSSYL